MQANVGALDRSIRAILGIDLLCLLFVMDGPVRWVGLLGIVPLLTAVVKFCPLYSIFGINSCPQPKGG